MKKKIEPKESQSWTIPLLLITAYTRQLEILLTALSVTHNTLLQPSQFSTYYLARCKKCVWLVVITKYTIFTRIVYYPIIQPTYVVGMSLLSG